MNGRVATKHKRLKIDVSFNTLTNMTHGKCA